MLTTNPPTRRERREALFSKVIAETLESRQLLASVAATTPTHGLQAVATTSNVTVRFNEDMNAATLSSATVQLRDAAGTLVPATYAYSSATKTLTIDPNASLSSTNMYYSVRVVSGASGVKDAANGALSSDYVFAFTTGAPTFADQTPFTGLLEPTNVEFAADGRVFVAEKRGVIKVFDSLTDTTPTVFADLRTNVHNFWDRGLLGMTLDPQFTTGRPYIYVLYTFDGDPGGTAPKYGTANTDSDPGNNDGTSIVSGRLSRLTANGNTMTGSELVLVSDWRNQYPSHSIGDLQFGPDGYLYASGGDGASFNGVDYGQSSNPFGDPTNEGGAVRSQDIRSSGDPTALNGTVIRINPDTGAGAPGNPFASSSDANERRIISYGLRNPYRISVRPGTNEIWIADTGWNTFEELNRITNPSDANAENFGWPAYEGPNRQSGYDAANLPLLESLYAAGASAHSTPWFYYNHNEKVVAGSSEATGGSTPTGIAFYDKSAYPIGYSGAMFFMDYARQQIYVMYRGVDGLPDPSTRKIFRTVTNTGPVDLVVGPDGNLYYAGLYDGKIHRIVFTGTVQPPPPDPTGKLAGTIIGTSGSYANNGYTKENVFDGNFGTFFDAPTASGAWVGLDLGTAQIVKQIRYAPAGHWPSRMLGGKFQASNDPTFTTGVVTLATVTTIPATGVLISVNVNASNTSYRYVRYYGPDTAACNISELEFYDVGGDVEPPPPEPDGKLTGTIIGTTGSYANNGYTRDKVFDGNFGTFFDAPIMSGAWVGLDLGSPKALSQIKFAPASHWPSRMTGGKFQASNDPNFSTGVVDLYTVTGVPTINVLTAINVAGTFRYVRYLGPDTAACNIAEMEVYGAAVTSQPPVATIDTPLDTIRWTVGEVLNFSGTATDPEDGALPASAYEWTLVLIHGNEIDPNNTHEHIVQSFVGVSSGSFVAPQHEYPSWLELRLKVTDSNGNVVTVSRRLDPATVSVTLESDPGGAALTFDGDTEVNITRHAMVGASVTISAPAQIVVGGITYQFVSWSDGGAITHDIIVEDINATYTANYALPSTPEAPTELIATTVTNTRIDLSWDDNAGAETGYRIERRVGAGAWEEIGTVGINETTYSDTTVTLDTVYEYRVRAYNAAGNSAYSDSSTATTGPAAPTTLAKSASTSTSITITWVDNASTESGFLVQRRPVGGTFVTIATLGANAVTYTNTGLAANATYEYRVIAFSSVGESLPSNTLSASTTATLPTAPTNLRASVASNRRVTLTWQDNTGVETGYRVERRIGAGAWSLIGSPAVNATTYTDTTSVTNTTYEYRVYAVNGTVNSGFSNSVIVNTAVVGAVAPLAPSSLTATRATSTSANLSWTDNATNEAGYKIERKLSTSSTWTQVATVGANVKTFSNTGLVAGSTYQYRVRAYYNSTNSAYSNTATA